MIATIAFCIVLAIAALVIALWVWVVIDEKRVMRRNMEGRRTMWPWRDMYQRKD